MTSTDQMTLARQIMARVNATGEHRITDLLALPYEQVAGRACARGLCLACGAELEVHFLLQGGPAIAGTARSGYCRPRSWWTEGTGAGHARVRDLARVARTDPTFLGHQLAAYSHAEGLDDDGLARRLSTQGGGLHRLELAPALYPSTTVDASTHLVAELARLAGTAPHVLAPVLRAALDAAGLAKVEQATRARQAAIERAHREVEAAQARLDALLAVEPHAGTTVG